MPRNILAQPELLGQNGIALRSLDHVQEAEIRKPRAIVARHRAHDLLVAARDEHVGDRFIDRFSFSDREHMRLAFGAGIGDQRIGLEALGLPEYRAGDIDRIVKGKLMDDVDRGAVEASELSGKLRAGSDFDFVRQSSDHGAECPYLVVAVAAGNHDVSGMPQGPLAAFGRASGDSLLKLLEKRT